VTQFYDFLAPVLGIAGAVALLLLIVFLLLGPTRKFWVFLLYVSWELVASVGLTLADVRLHGTAQASGTDAGRLYARLYWTNDVLLDLLRFVLASVLIYQVVVFAISTDFPPREIANSFSRVVSQGDLV
jgi:hypothetical protein